MCEPLTIATIATTVLTTASNFMKQGIERKAQQASAMYSAQLADDRAASEHKLAQNEIQKGISEKNQQQRNALRQMGTMRANMGASGFEMDSGTNLSLLDETATEHQYTSDLIQQNAAQSAWQHQVAAASAENQANLTRYQARNNSKTSLLGMGSTLLGGMGSVLNEFKK